MIFTEKNQSMMLMEKNQSLYEQLIIGTKLNISSVICHLKHIAQLKLKADFVKNSLKTINDEVKRGNIN